MMFIDNVFALDFYILLRNWKHECEKASKNGATAVVKKIWKKRIAIWASLSLKSFRITCVLHTRERLARKL